MKIDIKVPDGQSGEWKIVTKTITDEMAKLGRLQSLFASHGRYTPAGTYKGLIRNGTIVMSNTPDEIRDAENFIWKAKGKVLINGLGMGVVVVALLEKPEVTEITIIEKSEDVIKLVAPTYQNGRVNIIHADAFTWQPPKGKRYDCVWHDIWDTICEDNLDEMGKLHRKYGRRTDYQESWCKYECQQQRRESRRNYYY